MYRVGIVVAIDEKKAMARVRWIDIDGEVSYWLPVMQKKTLKDKEYWLPEINEHVVCLIDDNAEEGIILGAIYSDADTPPVQEKEKKHIKFEDGTEIEYDKSSHKYRVYVSDGEIELIAKKKVTIKAPIIQMQGSSPSNVVFEGDFRIIGNVYVEGNIHATGTIVDDGGNTNHHIH